MKGDIMLTHECSFEDYCISVNFCLTELLGAPEASIDDIRDQWNCNIDADEAGEAILHYRNLAKDFRRFSDIR